MKYLNVAHVTHAPKLHWSENAFSNLSRNSLAFNLFLTTPKLREYYFLYFFKGHAPPRGSLFLLVPIWQHPTVTALVKIRRVLDTESRVCLVVLL